MKRETRTREEYYFNHSMMMQVNPYLNMLINKVNNKQRTIEKEIQAHLRKRRN